MQELTAAQAALIISGHVLSAIRLLTASRAIWGTTAPTRWATVIIPAVLVGLGAVPAALEGAGSWVDIIVALTMAINTGFAASRGPTVPADQGKPGAGDGPDGKPLGFSTPIVPRFDTIKPDDSKLLFAGIGFIATGFVLALLGCGSAQPAPPCDAASLAAITAECSALAYQCGKDGVPENECAAIADCDARLDERAEQCR